MGFPGSTVRGWTMSYALALGLALALTVTGLVAVNVVFDRKLAEIERIEVDVAPDTGPGQPANYLLIGSDTREFVESVEEEGAFGDPEVETGQRSDTVMIVHVDPQARTGLLVSFPRDLLIDSDGDGDNDTMINSTFNEGPQGVIDAIQANYAIPIHHYLEIDFASFEGIVNAIGGVPIYLDAPARDNPPPPQESSFEITGYFNFQPGCYELDGALALAYVRSRYYEEYIDGEWRIDGTADLGRIRRQQEFMRRLAVEAVRVALDNPLKANDVSNEIISELKADEGLSSGDVKKLINAFRNVDPNDLNSIRMETIPTVPAANDPNRLELDEAGAAPLFRLLQAAEATQPEADGPAPSSIHVRVFNGSGQDGAAAGTLEALQELGFVGVGVGDNPDGTIEATEVRYRLGSEDKAEVVLEYLGGAGTLIEDDSIVEADVLLVLGEEFDGLVVPEGATETTVTTVAPAPTESSLEAETEPEQEPTPGAEPTAPEVQCS